ncbi:MAG: thioredoxin family protein [Muribaculaceae bacterium]|nr:thioredoxin family protein [Muribaculaceae bacterium]
MQRLYTIILSLMVFAFGANAQMLEPIVWSSTIKMTSNNEGVMTFKASIDDGWHLYSFDLPENGPNATKISFDKTSGIELLGDIVPSRQPIDTVDLVFNIRVGWWDADVEFSQKFKVLEEGKYDIAGEIYFQACNGETCIAPTTETFDFKEGQIQATQDVNNVPQSQNVVVNKSSDSSWWQPTNVPAAKAQTPQTTTNAPWWQIFLWGFLGGLAALITPCVWPLIPMTVSFFLKKNKTKAKSIKDAAIYGISIIVIYLVLGLAITLIFGAGKLNELATDPIFNMIFFALLVVFGISFLGAFDIKLPSKWSNSIDNKVESTTGFISIFFMAFTLALVSFSCTGPLIGTLLVEAASIGDISGPAIGMTGFAIALAIPFTLFAIFPSWLKEMPKSGGWLNSVKVVLGFLELALALKFLSVADLCAGWGILDREVFLVLWIVIFAMLGFYLLGKIKFSHDSDLPYVSVPRLFMAIVSFAFVVYLIPGLWGAPLKSVSAFVPPLKTQDFNLYGGGFKEFDDFDEGMRYAQEQGMPVLVDFTGYGCVNCRKMESAVFDTDKVRSVLEDNYVLIKLVVDDKTQLSDPYAINVEGKEKLIDQVGKKWSYLQQHKFGANSQPYYIVLDNSGNALTPYQAYDPEEDADAFANWLKDGIKKYKEVK